MARYKFGTLFLVVYMATTLQTIVVLQLSFQLSFVK
jgi:hypothetical protein